MLANTLRLTSLRAAAAPRLVMAPAASRTLTSSARLFRGPPKPTQSEEAAKHHDHDMTPEELQKQTAQEANTQRDVEMPTHSEDAVHGERHGHDPLPDHKKKKSSKPEH